MTDIGAKLAQLEKAVKDLQRASRLSYASLDDAALEVRDGAGSLRGIVGQQGDGTTAVNIVNGPPPPQPSTPIIGPVLGGVTASWDGLFADDQVLPLDWSRTEVHAAAGSGFTPDATTLCSTIETAQGATVVIPTETPVYVRFVARSTSGTPSMPSTETGPLGPAPVVATDILDGIVTTVKLAESAVTAAKVATGAIGTTKITDGAVTTPKIIAGAVQAAQLDALAVNASKIAAGAVTTAKLDALAVTTDKLAANAITVGKLAAGSVDATALKADAITGKTITGGSVNGAVVTGGIVQTGAFGQRVVLNPQAADPTDPTATVPAVELYSGAAGQTGPGSLSAQVTDDTSAYPYASLCSPSVASIGPNGQFINSELRLLSSQPGVRGGSFELNANANPYNSASGQAAAYGYVAKDSAGTSSLTLSCSDGTNAPGGNGSLGPGTILGMSGSQISLRARNNTADQTTTITPTGVAIGGTLTVSATPFTTYTPVVAGGGLATFSTRTGWYYKLGKMVYFCADVVVSAAGSGNATVTITAPSSIYRGTRQVLPVHGRGVYLFGLAANGHAYTYETGAGAVIDQITMSNDNANNRDGIVNGTALVADARITIQGWYREA
ncbi:hypothetical protein AB0K62_13905 [Streptomyces halstedii]|uniref:hypothetical protein n=1 Tax=Streptomyces halstedii TaxID=1944 RepID=UPI00345F5A8B